MEVSGRVRKLVRRDGCKLIIEPGEVLLGLVVFADCQGDAETVRNSEIRKGSSVAVRGKFQSFGASAVGLSDCRLQIPEGKLQIDTLKKQRKNRDISRKFVIKNKKEVADVEKRWRLADLRKLDFLIN